MPTTAPPQTMQSTAVRAQPLRAIPATAVYEPAMAMKMVEWSARRIRRRPTGPQVCRWKRALTPNSSEMEKA